jgi:hypothetical protein
MKVRLAGMLRTRVQLQKLTWRLIVCLSLVIFLSGCVLRRIAFSNAERVIRYQVGSTVDLTRSQALFLEKEVPAFLRGLRDAEVRIAQALISELGVRSQSPISRSDIDEFFVRWDALAFAVVQRASVPVGEFQATLSRAQLVQWKKAQNKRAGRRLERLERGEASYKGARIELLSDQFSKWIGPLNETQLAALKSHIDVEYAALGAETRAMQRSQTTVHRAIEASLGAKVLQGIFIQQSTFPFSGLDPEHAKFRLDRRESWKTLLTVVASSLSNEQLSKFKSEIDALSRDLSHIGKSL